MIPARRTSVTALCIHAFLAMLTGLALRLLFDLQFPAPAGDSGLYLQLARNWADHHIYGLWLNGQPVPTDLRMPGYPAFLAGVAIVLGRSDRAIVLSQAGLDLCTCFLAAALAAALAPSVARRRVAIAGLWLAATCPFLANYTAAVLSEVLTAFLTTAALVFFVVGLKRETTEFPFLGHLSPVTAAMATLLGAFLTGIASLVRPETPLLLVVAGAVFTLRWWRFLGWRKIVLTGMAMSLVFFLPLMPWVARNFISLHKLQISAARYTTTPGEYAPIGYYKWANTWMVRFREVYISVWKLNEEPVEINDFPVSAFDSPEEKQRVAELFDEYNKSPTLDISPEVDRGFAEIARERTRRHPLRTYLWAPFGRALTMWFTPRTEILPIDGKFWPILDSWEDSHAGFLTTAGFGALGYLYPALALAGIWIVWRYGRTGSAELRAEGSHRLATHIEDSPNLWAIALLVVYMLVRTAFLTTVEAPEPRYVVTCYPAILALAALVWVGKRESRVAPPFQIDRANVIAPEARQNVAQPGRAGTDGKRNSEHRRCDT
jgi:hypothetical protein